MPLALLSSWKEGLIALLLVSFGLLYAHDRIVSAKLSAAESKQAALQLNADALAKEIDKQSAAIKALSAERDQYQTRVIEAVSTANSLRMAQGQEHTKAQALKVPTECIDAINYLSSYWRSQAAPKP